MNNENAYNLIDEPWIPVLKRDGTNQKVSIGEIFSDEGGHIADLALNPYERVAVFRLLLCIAQAALGSERLKDESGWLAVKRDIGPVSTDYLKKWHDRFFLYGPHAFLQPDDIGTEESLNSTVSKLCLEWASGSNSTLFDHEASNARREMADCCRAINFLVFQSFSAGGRFSSCVWDGELSPMNGSAFSAPCREADMLFSILLGGNLQESIWLNLLSEKTLRAAHISWGRPAWEHDNITRKIGKEVVFTYLGHLVPVSRVVKLTEESNRVVMGEGFVYPTLNSDLKNPEKRPYGWREAMCTIRMNGDDRPEYISSDLDRMPWRDLTSILSIRGTIGQSSALCLRHLESIPSETEFNLWTGGLCTDQAKDIGDVQWNARLSVSLLEDAGLKKYDMAIQWADKQESALYWACKTYALVVKTPDPAKVINKSKEKELVRAYCVPAERAYWDILAQPENQKLVQDVDSPVYLERWKHATWNAAKEAYQRACPAKTARQMEAFAQGFSKLTIREEN